VLELGESRRLLHVRQGGGILEHGLEVFDASPLGVIGNLRAVKAAMNIGGNKAWHMTHGSLGGVNLNC
jgi:hypothetical protein